MERRVWLRGIWEMVKAAFCQKLLTRHLPSSPQLVIPQKLSGVSVIVTGCNSGIGLHTAKELAAAGAHVVMACRNVKAARDIARDWKETAYGDHVPNVEVMSLDLLSLASVRSFAAEWERRDAPLDVLINNAGIFLMGEPQRFSCDGMEEHVQVNHVAAALLTMLLLPSLLRAPSSRIVNVNSVAHHCAIVDPKVWKSRLDGRKFSSMRAYGASKLAHLMFLKALASKLHDCHESSVQCIAVHPGIVSTNLLNDASFRRKSFWRLNPEEGARAVLYCALSADVGSNLTKGFAYYSCNCKPAKVSPQASDMEKCFKVWDKTLAASALPAAYLSEVITNNALYRITSIEKQI